MYMDEELPLALRNLARLLPLRGPGQPFHLLLTSSLSLTSALFGRVCGTDDRRIFRQYMRELSLNDRLSMLTYHLKDGERGDGYRALAGLILRGYFSTIITTNTDSLLEEALIEMGARLNDMQVLLVGRDHPTYIADALVNRSKPITILRLHGSLNEHVLPESFPDVFTYPEKVEALLTQLLAQDIIIVGNLEQEPTIQRLLPVLSRSALYAVFPYLTGDGQDYVSRILEARHYAPSAFIVQGFYGNFHTFFSSLSSLMHPGGTTVVEVSLPQPRLSPPLHVQPSIKTGPEKAMQLTEPVNRCDVLLVTATSKEARAVFDICKNERRLGFSARHHPYHDLGLIGNARVGLMLQSSIGAGGLGGARFTISEGIQALHPSAVIMVGVACGLKPGEQRIGDILVSERLADYEPQKIGTEQQTLEATLYQRGERVSAPPLILSYFKNGQLLLDFANWPQTPNIFFGLILSGDKLLDNLAVRENLLGKEPEAIGLEMEGVGLYEAATSAHVNWLLVKAISDWGDGKKAERKEQFQQLAAENAARFTLEIIAQGGFADQER